MELIIEPVRYHRRQASAKQVHESSQQLEKTLYCADRLNTSHTVRPFAKIRFPADTKDKNSTCIVLAAKQTSANASYDDIWGSFSDTCTNSAVSEHIEWTEEHTQVNGDPQLTVIPTVINVQLPFSECSRANKGAVEQSVQPKVYQKRYLPTSTILSPVYSFRNRRRPEHVSFNKMEPSRLKREESMSHTQPSHSVDVAIAWHKHGKHIESVLHIDTY